MSMTKEEAIQELKSLSPSAKTIETIINLIKEQEKEIDCLKNHVHYIKCQKCGIEFRTKRSDRKYCKKCAELVNKKIIKIGMKI